MRERFALRRRVRDLADLPQNAPRCVCWRKWGTIWPFDAKKILQEKPIWAKVIAGERSASYRKEPTLLAMSIIGKVPPATFSIDPRCGADVLGENHHKHRTTIDLR